MQRIDGRVGGFAGELAEVIRTVGVGHELAEKTLVSRRPVIGGRRCIPGGELALELFTHLLGGVALERVLRVMGNVDDEIAGVAILLTDAEHHAACHPALHQIQVTKPDGLVTDLGMNFALSDREDHCVVFGIDVLFQQGQFGCGPHCRFLTGNELIAKWRLFLRIR
ncbi:hypothetical protein D3C71_748250 [compost metagenome]